MRVNLFGHANARSNAALKDQLDRLAHVMLAGFTHEPAIELFHEALHAAARRGLLEREEMQAIGAWDHAGSFSADASVRVEANDRQALERPLRYCARPAFALERLREIDPNHVTWRG